MSVLDQSDGLHTPYSALHPNPPPTPIESNTLIALYQAIVASMHEAVVVYSTDGRVLIANASARDLLGLGHGEGWVHPTWRIITPNGAPLPPSTFPAHLTLSTGQPQHDIVIGLERPTDDTVWLAIGTHNLVSDGVRQGVVMTMRDITQQHCLERSLRFIAERGEQRGSHTYLEAVALYLTKTFKVDLVIIGELLPDGSRTIRTHVHYLDGDFQPNYAYSLAHTPCEQVVNRAICCYPHDVTQTFPDDGDLVDMGAESYAGVPLWDSTGAALGILNMVSRRPMHRLDTIRQALELFAVSVAHELEQARLESLNRQTATELQHSLARLYQVMHLSHLGIATWDMVTDRTEWWGEMSTIFGIAEDEFTGLGSDYITMIHPDDLPTVGKIAADAFDNAITEAELLTRRVVNAPSTFRVVRRDGTVRFVEGSGVAVVDEQGVPLRLYGFLQDVTERHTLEAELGTYRHNLEKLVDQRTAELGATNARLHREIAERVQAEAALFAEKEQNETILRHVANPVILTDPSGTILYVNPAFERFYGYSAAEVSGANPRILQSSATPRKTYTEMWQTLVAGDTWSGLVFNRTKAGSTVDINLTIVPVRTPRGETLHFVAVHHDVTEARRFAAMKETFVANAAHDLANPVAALSITLDLLKAAPALFTDRLPALERQVKRLNSLVSDLLLVSRLDRQLLDRNIEVLDWHSLVGAVVESQQVIAQSKGIHLSFTPDAAGLLVAGDRYQLERVAVNLVANALNYTLTGGQVRVTTQRDHHRAILRVQDTGIGIEASEIPRIFERFYRTEAARQHTYGTGLGLAIVKEIVDLHEGQIEVESHVGRGTTVEVRLSLAAD